MFESSFRWVKKDKVPTLWSYVLALKVLGCINCTLEGIGDPIKNLLTGIYFYPTTNTVTPFSLEPNFSALEHEKKNAQVLAKNLT